MCHPRFLFHAMVVASWVKIEKGQQFLTHYSEIARFWFKLSLQRVILFWPIFISDTFLYLTNFVMGHNLWPKVLKHVYTVILCYLFVPLSSMFEVHSTFSSHMTMRVKYTPSWSLLISSLLLPHSSSISCEATSFGSVIAAKTKNMQVIRFRGQCFSLWRLWADCEPKTKGGCGGAIAQKRKQTTQHWR